MSEIGSENYFSVNVVGVVVYRVLRLQSPHSDHEGSGTVDPSMKLPYWGSKACPFFFWTNTIDSVHYLRIDETLLTCYLPFSTASSSHTSPSFRVLLRSIFESGQLYVGTSMEM